MIIARLQGGLGNQMFQYAAARSLALRNNTLLKLELGFLKDGILGANVAYRNYELIKEELFHITPLGILSYLQGDMRKYRGMPLKIIIRILRN